MNCSVVGGGFSQAAVGLEPSMSPKVEPSVSSETRQVYDAVLDGVQHVPAAGL